MRLALILLLVVPIAFAKPPSRAAESPYHEEAIAAEKALALPGCDGLSEAPRATCERIRKARQMADSCALSVYKDPKKGIMREFCIIAHEPVTDSLHEIRLEMPVVARTDFQPRVKTEGEIPYVVIRVAGSSYNKMRFLVFQGEERLYAYAAKHLRIPSGTNVADLSALRSAVEPFVYLASDEHLLHPELAQKGFDFVVRSLKVPHDDVRSIPSRAVPGRAIGDVFGLATPIMFLVAEQTDPDRIFGGKEWKLLLEKTGDPFEEEAVRAVFVDFFMNGLDAYRYVCSKANACGPFQFTNAFRGSHPGTYEVVRRAYPQANLDPDFRRGTQGFRNSAKAAMLLLDLELSNERLGKRVREDFAREPEFGILYAGAAYNGGASQAYRLAQFFDRHERRAGGAVTLESLPWKELARAVHGQKLMPRETLGYIRKLFMLNGLHHPVFRDSRSSASP